MLYAHRKAGQPLYARSICNYHNFCYAKEGFKSTCSRKLNFIHDIFYWERTYAKNELNWYCRKFTIRVSKLPKDWELQGLRMTQRITYLIKCYNVPCELVVNTNQTGINLVPICETKTWEEKRSKHVTVIGIEENRFHLHYRVTSYLFKSFSQEQQV